MKRTSIWIAALMLFATPALASLKVGEAAPDFTAPATLAGKPFTFSLKDALKKGPVVLYFFPAAFTKGCTIEAHEFAEATAEFNAMGATVIGMSADDMEKLNAFSVSECRNKFAVASDKDQKIMKAYDSVLMLKPDISNRTTYVITPDHKISFVYSALDPTGHVQKSLDAVKAYHAAHK